MMGETGKKGERKCAKSWQIWQGGAKIIVKNNIVKPQLSEYIDDI